MFFLIEMFLGGLSHIDHSYTRFLMWSVPVFEIDPYGAVTLAKNASIREVAVYNGAIEYDIVYNTNNLGSVDHMNYERNIGKGFMGRRYAFVGDSLTVGSGGYPWASRLRDKVLSDKKNVQVYSFGIPGGGPWHFLKILESASRDLEFTDIVILAISGDMHRKYFLPIVENDRVNFCPCSATSKDVSLESWPIATIIDKNATESEILNHVRFLMSQEMEFRKSHRKNIVFFLRESHFLKLIKKSLNKLIRKFKIDLTPFVKIRSLFPNARIYFIHLPEREEVERGRYNLELKDLIESLGIKYYPALTEWKWSKAMYHENDGHPNTLGYNNILNCVDKYLFQE